MMQTIFKDLERILWTNEIEIVCVYYTLSTGSLGHYELWISEWNQNGSLEWNFRMEVHSRMEF